MRGRAPRFYFSFRSPYSWIAARWLEQSTLPAGVRIEYVPFWEPDATTLEFLRQRGGEFHYTPMSRAKHLYILQDVRRLARKEGLEVVWPVDRDPWWEVPHLAYLAAQRDGKGPEVFWGIYRARWEQGRDICCRSTIREIAAEVGADPELLAGAPEDPDTRELAAEALYQCYRDDVFGIPLFIHGRDKFWGTDRFADFAASLGLGVASAGSLPGPAREPSVPASGTVQEWFGGYESDHAGGCG